MIVSGIKPYSYTNLKTSNNRFNNNSNPIDNSQQSFKLNSFKKFKNVSFACSSPNWTENILGGYEEQLKSLQNILINPIKDCNDKQQRL